MPELMASYPSRRGGFKSHEVYRHEDGGLSCTCPAGERGIKCWAILKVAAELQVAKILGRESKPVAAFKFDFAVPREAFAEWAKWMREHEPSLEKTKAYQAHDLREASIRSYHKSHWDHYYAQFKP